MHKKWSFALVIMCLRICSSQDEATVFEAGDAVSPAAPVTEVTTGNSSDITDNATGTVLVSTTKAATVRPRACLNLHPLCLFWKVAGQCESNEDFMSFYCRKTCKKCDAVPVTFPIHVQNRTIQCGDNHEFCVFWSKRDQCNRNFYWMLRNCPFSCGYCSTKCRPCPPPPDTPPGIPEPPKLFLGTNAFQSGGVSVDFTNYRPNIPPEAFGLNGDPFINYHGQRQKRDNTLGYYLLPKQPKHPNYHGHGSGREWTNFPANGPCASVDNCATVTPLPCCIPVAFAESLGLIPLGQYVTAATPTTQSPYLLLAINEVLSGTNETTAGTTIATLPPAPVIAVRPAG